MKNSKWLKQLAYRFDNVMSRGVVSLIGLLFILSFVFIAATSFIVSSFKLYPPGQDFSFFEVMWLSLMRTIDAGTMGSDQGDGFRTAMLLVTICGLIIVASLIGVVSNAFNEKVEKLRKGRSQVLESDFTLILGWNSKIFTVLQEIAVANQSRKRAVIVVMANRDKVEMEDQIRDKMPEGSTSRIIIRSGDPISSIDLRIVNPQKARSIVILASDEDSHSDADSASIKTCLALLKMHEKHERSYHIVGEIKDSANLEAAYMVGGSDAHWVLGGHLLSSIIVQTSRQRGLSLVFTELLDFQGSEIYISKQPTLVGLTYGQAASRFTQGCVLGLIEDMQVRLNPDPAHVVTAAESFLVVAEDDSKITVGALASKVDDSSIQVIERLGHKPEKTLVLGTNKNLHEVLVEMTTYMADGSEVMIVADLPEPEIEQFEGLRVDYQQADTTSSKVLERLHVDQYHHIVVLSDRDRFEPEQGDARTLLTLLHLRELGRKLGANLNIVSEMLDDRNRELAETTDADDFIVSDKLVSLMIAQIEESPEISHVFKPLLSSEGALLRLNPVEWYVKTGVPVTFDTVIGSASRQSESALGFDLKNLHESVSEHHGVKLNPARAETRVFEPGDRIVVLSHQR